MPVSDAFLTRPVLDKSASSCTTPTKVLLFGKNFLDLSEVIYIPSHECSDEACDGHC